MISPISNNIVNIEGGISEAMEPYTNFFNSNYDSNNPIASPLSNMLFPNRINDLS